MWTSIKLLLLACHSNAISLSVLIYIRSGLIEIIRIANSAEPDQTASKKQSDLGQHCLSVPFWQATTVGFGIVVQTTVNCKVS